MALDVVFRPQAEDEVLEVRQWYESKRFGLGREFGDELNRVVERIAAGPLQFHAFTERLVEPCYRASRTPCTFRVADAAVVVLAIHGRNIHPSVSWVALACVHTAAAAMALFLMIRFGNFW